MNQVKFGSNLIKYVIFKTNRIKTSEIIVDKDNVILRCPSSKTNEELEQIMTQKARWIFEKQQQYKSKISIPHQQNQDFIKSKELFHSTSRKMGRVHKISNFLSI